MQGESKRLRIVFDTNVLVSALALQGRETSVLWDLSVEDKFNLFLSPFILDEFENVLNKKSGLNQGEIAELMEAVRRIAQIVEPKNRTNTIKGKDSDNRILECAAESKADVLVTGDLKHIRPLNFWGVTEILTPREFLKKHFPQ